MYDYICEFGDILSKINMFAPTLCESKPTGTRVPQLRGSGQSMPWKRPWSCWIENVSSVKGSRPRCPSCQLWRIRPLLTSLLGSTIPCLNGCYEKVAVYLCSDQLTVLLLPSQSKDDSTDWQASPWLDFEVPWPCWMLAPISGPGEVAGWSFGVPWLKSCWSALLRCTSITTTENTAKILISNFEGRRKSNTFQWWYESTYIHMFS